ncbi:hypothetical protein MBLNU459_g6682t1 [Dothideomycetes sp. NU459]
MATIQLNFTLRTSSNCKSVHLVGTWDGYRSQLPLSRDPDKSGGWKGTFRFPGTTMQQGQRYWYYYVIDGHHVSHDPARESIVEPTSGRKLNIIDIPPAKGQAKPVSTSKISSSHKRYSSVDVPKGRSLSPSQIKSPKPTKPHETRAIAHEKFNPRAVEQLTHRLQNQQLEESDEDSSSEEDSDGSSDVPSLTSRSSNTSTPSSVSSTGSCCTCERYGITRAGNRVKLDCGGSRCGYSDASSECSSESENDHRRRTTRRQGMVVRK